MTTWIDHLTNREDPFGKLMQDISQSAAEPIDLNEYCELVLEQISAIFQPRSAGLFLKQKAAGRFHLNARLGLATGDIQLDLRHPLPVYLDQHPQPLPAAKLDILPFFRALWQAERNMLPQLNAEVFLPLKAGGDLVGILALGPKHAGKKYSPAEQQNLTMLCNQVAQAIRNHYLTTAESRWRQEAESMKRAMSEITTDCDLEEALHRNLLHIRADFPFDTATMVLLQGDRLVVTAAHGFSPAADVLGHDEPAAANMLFQDILVSHKALLVEDTAQDERFKHYDGPPVQRVWMGVPLISRGEVIGLLALSSRKSGSFQVNPARLELVQFYANQAAIIVEKTRLVRMERQQRQMADVLENIGSEVETLQDFDQVLDFLLDQIGKAIPADITTLFLAEGSRLNLVRTVFSGDLDPEVCQLAQQPAFEASTFANLQYLINDKRAQVISDTETDSEWALGPIAIRSWAGTPVLSDGKVIACFSFASLKPAAYPGGLIELLGIFANQAAMALQNFRLVHKVSELATYDELTGVYNQRHFLELGEREFRRARRFHHQLSVVFIEVDHFEDIQAKYGEDASGQMLSGVADLINANIRNVDVLARYQDAVFALILTETDRPGAKIISERLQVLIGEAPHITTAGLVKVTVSVGVAILENGSPDLAALLKNAMQSLEEARQAGRDRVVIFPAPSPAKQ
jgi:diguanylate cyclase (GGDEF)-like protein